MDIRINHLISGAQHAEGLTVIIDVFRAFSMECYLYAQGAREVRPVGSIEETFTWREKDSECVLVGERHGIRIDGCDLGNSPSSINPEMIQGKRVIHTTSAGTQGIVNAVHADEVITGSFVNAKAIAAYIRSKAPAKVTLVCMGKEGITLAEEDELCAIYIEGLLTGRGMPDIDEKLRALRNGNGKHFFDPCRQADFPEKDFWMCIDRDKFDFVLKAEKDSNGYLSRMIPGTGFPG